MTLTLIDFFCGAGGSSQGATAIPGVTARLAANHWERAIESHAANFPGTEHFRGDLHDADVARFPAGDLFWASPECPQWSQARGKQRDFDKQPDLFGETLPDEATDRSRALMWDVPKYLEAMWLRGRPVLGGVTENVTDVRNWIDWRTWVRSIENCGPGYRTWLIAINSMHARPVATPWAPQSRDRLYLAYLSKKVKRDPDWDRWLRPRAWCPSCEQVVTAVQWWKRPGNDMGRYRQQYVYRCPRVACSQIVEPAAMPAAAAIDWSLAGTRVGDRAVPLKPKIIARIEAGLRRYARPITMQTGGSDRFAGSRTYPADRPLATQTATQTQALACQPMMIPAGGTWRNDATSVAEPMPARTARENDGLAVPPFLVPLRSGRNRSVLAGSEPLATVVADGGNHGLVSSPFITVHRGGDGDVRTADIRGELPAVTASGNHLGLAVPPFIAELRNGQDARPVTDPFSTVMTMGAHHGLVTPPELAMIMRNNTARGDQGQMSTPASEPLRTLTAAGHQSLITWEHLAHLLMPYYGTGVARTAAEPVGAITATDRWALASSAVSVEDVLFRMLQPGEIGAAMAFAASYQVLGSKRERVRQYGNAVTPPVAEVIISALVEAITGEDLERSQ